MNKRTRILAFTTLGLAGFILVATGIRASVVRPLRAIDDQIVQLQLKLRSVDNERKAFLAADDQVRNLAERLFGSTPDTAESRLGTLITTHLAEAGLRETDFGRIPTARRRLPGAEEIGWTVQGEGPLPQVVDFLFLLQAQPRLHRMESLTLSPANDAQRVRVRFRYLTPVPTPARPSPLATNLTPPSLASDLRRPYDAITRRDLLRPHEPPPASPPTTDSAPTSPNPSSPEPPPDHARHLRLVSLSSWGSPPEAHILDASTQQTRAYHPGDSLLDGTLAAIDYRPLPAAGKTGLLAYSRLILRVGNEYWAVDNGQHLTERRRLESQDLPPTLSPISPTPSNP